MSSTNSMVDVAIVGGGCAGLYCAWRLAMQPTRPSTYVFEKDKRVGGRLLSVDLLPEHGLKAELGGMRYTANHRLLRNLIAALRGSPSGSSPLDPRDFTFETSLMFLRGRHIHSGPSWKEDLRYDLPSPYTSEDPTRGLAAVTVDIAKDAIYKALAHAEIEPELASHLSTLTKNLTKQCLSLKEWRELQIGATVDGIALYNLGFWNLLQHCLHETPDEFLFLHDALGYESLVANSNAAQLIPVFLADFDVDRYFTLAGGMESVPRLLAFRSRQRNPNCLIADHHTVESITRREDDQGVAFEIAVRCTPSLVNRKKISYSATYLSRAVILALPQASLKGLRLHGFSTADEDAFRKNLELVDAHPAFKLYLQYDYPWWKSELGLRARAVTDLPIRQVYYMGEETDPDGPALVMASYNDEHYVDFWRPLVDDPKRYREAIQMKEEAMTQRRDITAYTASQRIIDKAEGQLRLLHPKIDIPAARSGVVRQWEDAWHFWRVHSKPWETAEKLVKPFENANLFLCGEAYSLEQGWIEGALKSAERVMIAMGLPPLLETEDFAEYISH